MSQSSFTLGAHPRRTTSSQSLQGLCVLRAGTRGTAPHLRPSFHMRRGPARLDVCRAAVAHPAICRHFALAYGCHNRVGAKAQLGIETSSRLVYGIRVRARGQHSARPERGRAEGLGDRRQTAREDPWGQVILPRSEHESGQAPACRQGDAVAEAGSGTQLARPRYGPSAGLRMT
jgi:hypothetical protein